MKKYYLDGKQISVDELRSLPKTRTIDVVVKDDEGNECRPFRTILDKSPIAPFGF